MTEKDGDGQIGKQGETDKHGGQRQDRRGGRVGQLQMKGDIAKNNKNIESRKGEDRNYKFGWRFSPHRKGLSINNV